MVNLLETLWETEEGSPYKASGRFSIDVFNEFSTDYGVTAAFEGFL